MPHIQQAKPMWVRCHWPICKRSVDDVVTSIDRKQNCILKIVTVELTQPETDNMSRPAVEMMIRNNHAEVELPQQANVRMCDICLSW